MIDIMPGHLGINGAQMKLAMSGFIQILMVELSVLMRV